VRYSEWYCLVVVANRTGSLRKNWNGIEMADHKEDQLNWEIAMSDTKREQAWKLMQKLDRTQIMEITVGQASTVNLMEDLLEIYDEDLDELIEECNDRLG
jgi:hypothetical protein